MLAVALADGGLCLAPCTREDFWDEEVGADDGDELRTGADGREALSAGGSKAAQDAGATGEETPALPALHVQLPGPLAGGRPIR